MKIKDLKILMEQCDPESEVYFSMTSGCCGDQEDLEVGAAETFGVHDSGKPYEKGKAFLRVEFYALPGYESCRQVGNTLRAHEEYWKINPGVLEKIKNRKGL